MFADAIETVGRFTRPVKFITRKYKEPLVVPGTATMFFVNDEGCAVTCRHVASEIIRAGKVNQNYRSFKAACSAAAGDKTKKVSVRNLEQQFGLKGHPAAQMKVQFRGCVDVVAFDIVLHAKHDLAIIRFKDFKSRYYSGHAVFARNGSSIRPGDMLCRLGFPFPEFSDYQYNPEKDDIEWIDSKRGDTPRFPIEGMFTRHIADDSGSIVGIELSTPGLRGQSGGPLFNSEGIIYGIQSETRHLHLGFDVKDEKRLINGREEVVNNQPFLHVGRCVHVDIVKSFLDENRIKYYVGDHAVEAEEING